MSDMLLPRLLAFLRFRERLNCYNELFQRTGNAAHAHHWVMLQDLLCDVNVLVDISRFYMKRFPLPNSS